MLCVSCCWVLFQVFISVCDWLLVYPVALWVVFVWFTVRFTSSYVMHVMLEFRGVCACVCRNILQALPLSAKLSKAKVSSCYFSLTYLLPIFLSQHERPPSFILRSQKHHEKSGRVVLENIANFCVQIFFSITILKDLLFEWLPRHSGRSGVVCNILCWRWHISFWLMECTFFIFYRVPSCHFAFKEGTQRRNWNIKGILL